MSISALHLVAVYGLASEFKTFSASLDLVTLVFLDRLQRCADLSASDTKLKMFKCVTIYSRNILGATQALKFAM